MTTVRRRVEVEPKPTVEAPKPVGSSRRRVTVGGEELAALIKESLEDAVTDSIGEMVLEDRRSPYEVKFKLDFGVEYEEALEAWKIMHQPGVLNALKFALDLTRNPPTVEAGDNKALVEEIKASARTLILSACDDIPDLVHSELLNSDEVDEIILTDEDIPEHKERLDYTNKAVDTILKNGLKGLREEIASLLDESLPRFSDDGSAMEVDLGPEFSYLNAPDRIREANSLCLYLKKHAGEL